MLRIAQVRPLNPWQVQLDLTDGSSRHVDLAPLMVGPIFDAIKADVAMWRAVSVDPDLGTIIWPNGADLDPDVLIHGRPPATPVKASA
jgi:hypothetical protein